MTAKISMLTASMGYTELLATVEKQELAEEAKMFQDVDGDKLSENLDLEQRVILALSTADTNDNMTIMAGNFINALRNEGVVLSVRK